MHGWVINDSTNYFSAHYKGPRHPDKSQSCVTEIYGAIQMSVLLNLKSDITMT